MSTIFLGRNHAGEAQELRLDRANRHGLIAGATGTGKTVTLQGLAESFSAAGVPVFVADVKGDLSGLAVPGSSKFKHADKLESRAAELGMDDYAYADFPVIFWDLFGEQGHPVRTTVSEMGPLLLARLLDLNDTQEGVLQVVFRHADDNGLLLLDFEDLRSLLAWAADHTDEVSGEYGRVTKASIGAIQRALLTFESEGADKFFGEPALEVDDLFRVDAAGRGFISILAADKLMRSPKLYATYLFWLLAELFETLPEVGDPDKPKLVFFFDEAHLLFDVPYAQIEVVVHPQSVVHSMVEFSDGSTIAQASPPDMRLPISLGLDWPHRIAGVGLPIDWSTATTWSFEPLEDTAFPAVELAKRVGRAGGTYPAVFNAANEVAVDAFHDGRIGFLGILDTVERVVEAHEPPAALTRESLADAEDWARRTAAELL